MTDLPSVPSWKRLTARLMHWLDSTIVALLVMAAVLGAWSGLVLQLFRLVGFGLSLYSATYFNGWTSERVGKWFMQGADSRVVSAVGLGSGCRLSPELGTLDLQVALFRTDRGIPLKVLCAFGVAREPSFHAYTVYGTRGYLERPRPGRDAPDETLAYFEDVPEMAGMASLPLGIRHRRVPAQAALGGVAVRAGRRGRGVFAASALALTWSP